jgi:hypothetical protein
MVDAHLGPQLLHIAIHPCAERSRPTQQTKPSPPRSRPIRSVCSASYTNPRCQLGADHGRKPGWVKRRPASFPGVLHTLGARHNADGRAADGGRGRDPIFAPVLALPWDPFQNPFRRPVQLGGRWIKFPMHTLMLRPCFPASPHTLLHGPGRPVDGPPSLSHSKVVMDLPSAILGWLSRWGHVKSLR